MVDPYDWLGIPREQRPPTFYQLLRIVPAECDEQVLEHAAARQMARARAYQLRYPEEATRLQNTIARALATLLDRNARVTYDRFLAEGLPLEGSLAMAAAQPATAVGLGSPGPSAAESIPQQPELGWRHRFAFALVLGMLAASAVSLLVASDVILRQRRPADEKLRSEAARPMTLKSQKQPAMQQGAEDGKVAEPVPVAKEKPPAADKATNPRPSVAAGANKTTVPAGQSAATGEHPATRAANPSSASKAEAAAATAEVDRRRTLPPVEEQTRAEAAIRTRFSADFERTRPEDRAALADRLRRAAQTEEQTSIRFVLLQLAMDLGMEAGTLHTTLTAIQQMARDYQIESFPLCVLALDMASKSTNELTSRGVARSALALLDEAILDNQFEAAEHLLALAEGSAGRVVKRAEAEVRSDIEAARRRVGGFRQQYDTFLRAAERLKTVPQDAVAQGSLGNYLCLVNGNWDEGLSPLAGGRDAPLSALARQDLARPASERGKLEVADGWFRRGQREEALAKACLYARARYWYRESLTHRAGDRTGAEARLKEIESWARTQLTAGLRNALYPALGEAAPRPLAPAQIIAQNAPKEKKRPPVNQFANRQPNQFPMQQQQQQLFYPNGPVIMGGANGGVVGGVMPGSFGGYFRAGLVLKR
jgi:hypothetical protein